MKLTLLLKNKWTQTKLNQSLPSLIKNKWTLTLWHYRLQVNNNSEFNSFFKASWTWVGGQAQLRILPHIFWELSDDDDNTFEKYINFGRKKFIHSDTMFTII